MKPKTKDQQERVTSSNMQKGWKKRDNNEIIIRKN